MQKITMQQMAHAATVPSMGGVGGFVQQDDVTVITTHTGARITIEGTAVHIGGVDITGETAAEARTHDEIAAFWHGQAQGWAADAAHLEHEPAEVIIMGVLEIEGKVVDAPGFTLEQFTAAVERAKREQLRTTPGTGCVMVQSGSDDARYAVTRDRCDCMAGQTHRYCKHRALAIYLQDVQGVDIMRIPTIGFNERGVSVTIGRKPAAKAVA